MDFLRRCLLLMLLLALAACSDDPYEEASQLYRQARHFDPSIAAEFADPLGRAITLLEGFLSRNPDDPRATLLLWRCYSRTGNPRAPAMRASMLAMPEAMCEVLPGEIRAERDDYMRAQMVGLLGELNAMVDTEFLVELIEHDPAPGVQQAGIKVLAQLADGAALPPLLRKLHDGEEIVRAVAARALTAFPREEVVEALLGRLADNREVPEVRAQAALSLAEIGGVNRGLWHQIMPQLRQMLTEPSKSLSTRLLAGMVLARRGNAEGRELALQHANIEDPFTRGLAISTLGLTGEEQALPFIVAASRDDNWRLRLQAVEALGQLKDPRGLPALYKAKDDANELVREAARAAIERIKSSTAGGKATPSRSVRQ
ncbi:MAG: HEAT repeat domain-containing protein [candidate division KSB1 bacterium]|nr:HEAT repeat domain-containing protein [candidate division KSB1 bacterium]MDZ7275041.1 HEAT repeat domain-containing protein [candidate division KSB1 bacterium]MDZ7286511.1 HEAT repeat domain-containing protein [candidate division KSB1 bacterium]MDZ7299325.1 HEAT repeat domain-containing protein [candidate division KSB1 bacterium]MDZ7306997.1 HEAT repeat domain-containing protein [candidate division KSB1 bacterium]